MNLSDRIHDRIYDAKVAIRHAHFYRRVGDFSVDAMWPRVSIRRDRPGRRAKGAYVELQDSLYPDRGLALVTCGGSLGGTYGEEGSDHFREVRVVVGFLTLCARVDWKRP